MEITVEKPISTTPDFQKGLVVIGYNDSKTGERKFTDTGRFYLHDKWEFILGTLIKEGKIPISWYYHKEVARRMSKKRVAMYIIENGHCYGNLHCGDCPLFGLDCDPDRVNLAKNWLKNNI